MYKVLLAKFTQNTYLMSRLIDTGSELLVEGNYWRDTFWGVCSGTGQNMLGKLLMKLRGQFREALK